MSVQSVLSISGVPSLRPKSWINLFTMLLNDLIFITMVTKKPKPLVNWALTKYREAPTNKTN